MECPIEITEVRGVNPSSTGVVTSVVVSGTVTTIVSMVSIYEMLSEGGQRFTNRLHGSQDVTTKSNSM